MAQSALLDGAVRLPREEVDALALRVRGGDAEAAGRLVSAVGPMVVGMARKLARRRHELDDLVQEGALAILTAARSYDGSHAFTTYLGYAIRSGLRKHLLGAQLIRVPQSTAHNSATGSASPATAAAIARASRVYRESDAHRRAGEQEIRLDEVLADQPEPGDEPGPDPALARRAARLLAGLGERDREVVSRRLGLGGEPESLAAIAADLGISRERVRQIHDKAMGLLGNPASKSIGTKPNRVRPGATYEPYTILAQAGPHIGVKHWERRWLVRCECGAECTLPQGAFTGQFAIKTCKHKEAHRCA